MSDPVETRLEKGAAAMAVKMTIDDRSRLLAFADALLHWNRTYNLTAVARRDEVVDRHLLDSLSVLPWLRGSRIMDAGTGAGLPGLPLAILDDTRQYLLVDGNGKRVRFIRHVVRELGLDHVEARHARIGDLAPRPPADDILTRALAPLPRMVGWLAPWLEAGSRLLAMKSEPDPAELENLPGGYRTTRHELTVPGASGPRCLILVERE